ncbi:MAG: TIM-barrel domain-containing protein, partial [Cyanobacteria bacterium J06558_2]
MTNDIFPSDRIYKFLKVEEYFARYNEWSRLGTAASATFSEDEKTLSIQFTRNDGQTCTMLLQVVQNDTLRVRFNPNKSTKEQYSNSTRLIDRRKLNDTNPQTSESRSYEVDCQQTSKRFTLSTSSQSNPLLMKVVITLKPFQIQVYNNSVGNAQHAQIPVWQTAKSGIYYTPNGTEDFAVIQAVQKPVTAKYIGFGQQGRAKLGRNADQLNYFNFDNLGGRQVYNRGSLENREPLSHSEPFFYEFNGIPGSNNVNAILLDNPSQVFIDVGYANSSRYMFGTRFGDLDYYLFLGEEPKNILDSYTYLSGRPPLKPRYILGYHQGCYGYEKRKDLEWVVGKYRDYGIPLDGLAIDVDIQDDYRNFTIDTNNFPDPEGMFAYLRSQGVKCSTSITPIISKQDETDPSYYSTYQEGLENGYFILDRRHHSEDPKSKCKHYQIYADGNEYSPNNALVEGFNSNQPYIGEVYYGQNVAGEDLGTTGHYSDFGRSEVREWWGKQYQYLYEMGLEFVCQDLTNPVIRSNRGDMKGFPFHLLVTEDCDSANPQLAPALKVWNLYSYNLHQATYQGLNKLHELSDQLKWRENRRNFIIGQGGYVGSHRFAGLWTGDNSSHWDCLQMNVAQVLSLGMGALAVAGQDIGGFDTADNCDR